MADELNIKDINQKFKEKVFIQDYSTSEISGVKILKLKNFVGETGDLSELLRLDEDGKIADVPGFKIRQINRSRMFPNTIKAWHLHFKQDEIWYVAPNESLVLGLLDVREKSETCGKSLKITLGNTSSIAVYIPRGVAHGAANFSNQTTNLFYFISAQFNIESPDENRLPWDIIGEDFWTPEKA